MSGNANTTINGTQPSSCSSNPTAENIGITIAYCLIFLVSLAGNTVIGVMVYKIKTMRKPINFFIANMAMSDLLLPIILIPREIKALYIDSWLIDGPLGQVLCKLVGFLADVSFAVSIQSLVLIAVDRFGAVVYPLRSPLISSKLCPFFILATWIVAMAIHSLYLVAFKLVEYPEGLACIIQWNEAFGENSSFKNYYASLVVVFYFIPLLLIAILYIIILQKLKSQKIPGEQSISAGQQRQQRARNVLKMAMAIVLGFTVCWLPISIFWLLLLFASNILSQCGFYYFGIVTTLMALSNCAINPCICFIFSSNYREGLKTLFS